MKLIIAGSRTFNWWKTKHSMDTSLIDELLKIHNIFPTEVVCGCGGTDEAKAEIKRQNGEFASDQGIDLMGEVWADSNRVNIKRIPAKWKKLGRPAGPTRNIKMAEYADVLLLIWDGESRGSKNMKTCMEVLNKKVYEFIIK